MTAALDLAPDDITAELWRRGELSWKLDPHQLAVDQLFDAWNERRRTPEYIEHCQKLERALDDVWVEEIARRWGKTSKWIIKLTSIAIKRPGAVLTYATAFQKDIGDIIVPLANQLLADGPDDLRPKYQRSKNEGHEGLYFDNKSVIKLVGIDQHPDALRGRFSDGVVISEAGFVRKLENTVRAVLLPQFQRRPWAFLALESSTPEEFDHDFTRVFVPDAEARKAYIKRTIDDNTAIDPAEKARAIRQAGGIGHPTCDREYYCKQTRDPERMLVPEFSEDRHVVDPGRVPEYAHCYEALDPGTRDKFGIGWAYWDFERAKLVVQRSWAESNASTGDVADLLKVTERELWGSLTYWNGVKFKPNPYLRVSDVDPRFIHDMASEYGITIVPTAKDDAEAQLYALRNAFSQDKIEIWRDSGPLVSQLKAGTYNEQRTDWARSEVHGHFDCIAMLIYLWRNVVRTLNPYPPQYVGKDPAEHHAAAWVREKPKTSAAKAIERAFNSGNRFRPNKRAGGWR